MAQKCLECLVVDGNYSTARIGALFLGLISIAFFIWLIVLTVKLGKDEDTEANATQDCEWNKIAVTCSDKEDNKISTESKDNLEECKTLGNSTEAANFIFYSDDKKCTIYKGCDKTEIRNKPGLTYKKDKNKEWDEYGMTCGKNETSFQILAMVDSLEQCKEASKSVHGKFMFFLDPKSNLTKTECFFYDKCDSTRVLDPNDSGETYQCKIKNKNNKNKRNRNKDKNNRNKHKKHKKKH